MVHAVDMSPPHVVGHPSPGRRAGYAAAIGVNLCLLYVARHLLDWGWPAFLTEQYTELLPIITLSFVATIAANVLFVFYDVGWLKLLANAVTAAIGFWVAVRTYQVFPFDFSGYDHDWSGAARALLVLFMICTAVGGLVELVRCLAWPIRSHDEA